MPYLAISIKITNAQTLLGIHPTDIYPSFGIIQVSFGWTYRLFSVILPYSNQGCGDYSVQSDEFSQRKQTRPVRETEITSIPLTSSSAITPSPAVPTSSVAA